MSRRDSSQQEEEVLTGLALHAGGTGVGVAELTLQDTVHVLDFLLLLELGAVLLHFLALGGETVLSRRGISLFEGLVRAIDGLAELTGDAGGRTSISCHGSSSLDGLDFTAALRTATIVRHRGDVDDFGDDDSGVVDGTDGGLTAGARTLHIALDFPQTRVESGLGGVLGGHLGGVRGVLLGTAETALAGGRPADDLALGVRQGDDHVVEGRGDMGLAIGFNLDNSFLGGIRFLCHNSQSLLGGLLLVGDGLLLALAGTGVVLGALAAHRETAAVTDAAIATDVHEALDVHLDGGAEFTLDLVLLVDEITDGRDLGIIPVTDLDGAIDTAGVQDLPGGAAADAEDIGQAYLSMFVVR